MRSKVGSELISLRERSYDLTLSLLHEANTFTLLCFAMHYILDPLNNLFDLVMKEDMSMHFHFQVQTLLISGKNTLEQTALFPGGYQRTFCSIIFMTIFRDSDRIIFRRLNLVVRITILGVD